MIDISRALQSAVRSAFRKGTELTIVAGGSKSFYGRPPQGYPLNVGRHSGILSYEPSELVMSCRCGTPLTEIESVLADHHQQLPFEPPHFGPHATVGGTVACGLSGPRRPFAGAVRDCVLGCSLLNGRGEVLSFGGEVMKNVAGYDIARLMVGALGTLGLLLKLSFKVLPRPEQEITMTQEMSPTAAIETMNRWNAQPLPLSALCYDGSRIFARLSGSGKTVTSTRKMLGGERLSESEPFWLSLREQHRNFFRDGRNLWRLSIAPATPLLDLPGEWLLDWGGGLRWLKSDAAPGAVFEAAEAAGGHATLFRAEDRSGDVFQPLPSCLKRYHRRLKQAFDPSGVLNPKRMYQDW